MVRTLEKGCSHPKICPQCEGVYSEYEVHEGERFCIGVGIVIGFLLASAVYAVVILT